MNAKPKPDPHHATKPPLFFTREAARALMLAAQGLDGRPASLPTKSPAQKQDVLEVIVRMRLLQIDTIHVVARSPYLVLWSRLGAYDPRWLDELHAEAALFEGWAHEACFAPMGDYGLFRRFMLDRDQPRWRRFAQWLAARREQADLMLAVIAERGPVRASDFRRTDGERGMWWNWKPEKEALEVLFAAGEVMIARREKFHRLYDLRQRVIPHWDDRDAPPMETVIRTMVANSVRALGVAASSWVADYYRLPKATTARAIEDLAAEGRLVPVGINGIAEPAYVHADDLDLAARAAAGALTPTRTTLLSPFDPLVWDRKRAKTLFDFEYLIECYTPAAKRQYGYFTLPILHRGTLVGRLDPKAHRRDGRFEVKALHLEPAVEVSDDLVQGLAESLADCAAWHGTPRVEIAWANREGLAMAVEKRAGACQADRAGQIGGA